MGGQTILPGKILRKATIGEEEELQSNGSRFSNRKIFLKVFKVNSINSVELFILL